MTDYWTSTKSPPAMLHRRVYESPALEAHVRDNIAVCPSLLAIDVGLCAQTVKAYQRRLGVRPITNHRTYVK